MTNIRYTSFYAVKCKGRTIAYFQEPKSADAYVDKIKALLSRWDELAEEYDSPYVDMDANRAESEKVLGEIERLGAYADTEAENLWVKELYFND